MGKKIFSLIVLSFVINHAFSQIDDFLKKIPGVGDVFDEAVSTSIKDAYPSALWLNELDKQMSTVPDASFSTNLSPGYYKFRFNTFCLHAGAYAPTDGAGFLVAPLKGAKANLIKSILSRYGDHPEIDQKDVQILIWGIEAGQKFSDYPADFQMRVTPLLNPEEILSMQVNAKQITYDLLPNDVKQLLNYYDELKTKISNVNSSYEEIEQFAVKTGIAPVGKGSKDIPGGIWTSLGEGVYMRCFPEGYKKSNVEIYIPSDVKIEKDVSGNIVSLDDGSFHADFNYETSSKTFKSVSFKNLSTNEVTEVDNLPSENITNADEFLKLVKKSFGKKKSGRIDDKSYNELKQLKSIELSLNSIIDKNSSSLGGYTLAVNALNKFVSELESGLKKGGGESRVSGLENINGLVFAPANTALQRLGNGGPEGGNGGNKNPPPPPKKNCNPKITIHRISPDYLPEPGQIFNVTIDIQVDGDCKVEGVRWTLSDVSRELGRCCNEYDPAWYDTRLDFFIDPTFNATMSVSPDSLTAEGGPDNTTVVIGCNDYGAYAKISAEVKIDGNWMYATDEKSPYHYVSLPYDADGNHIADTWEITNGVLGLPATWDEDPNPSGQANNGDGLTNYEEYRGFYESDGSTGIEHVRTDPKTKDIFIIDEGQIFPKLTWEAASGIKSHWLTKEMVYGTRAGGDLTLYRWVDFCSGYAKGTKYAVNLIKVDGLGDPFGNYQDLGVGGYNDPGYGPPKKADRTVIFPDRVKYWLTSTADSLASWLKQMPGGFILEGVTYTPKQINKMIADIHNPAKFDAMVSFWTDLNVVHEVGHACNCYHHGGGDSTKTSTGDPKCPMKYRSEYEIAKLKSISQIFAIIDKEHITPIVSYTGWKFCNKKDNCWKQITVNDSK